MLSDDSSSDSESGRFKTHTKSERKETKNETSRSLKRGDPLPDLGRSRNSDRNFRREFDRREDRGRFDRRRSKERYDSRRYSPPRRRRSRDRSPELRGSPDRHRQHRDTEEHSKPRSIRDKEKRDDRESKRSDAIAEKRPEERGRKRHSPIVIASESKRNFKEEIRKNIVANICKEKSQDRDKVSRDRNSEKQNSSSKKSHILPHKHKDRETAIKMSEVHVPIEIQQIKSKSKSPIQGKPRSVDKEIKRSKSRRYSEEDKDESESEQPASYYNLVPATVDITEDVESIQSITDSDDEERLRAKLLNLEKELDKTRKKKGKKSKKKSKLKHKDKDDLVEVSSTTDIQGKLSEHENESESHMQAPEVSSTQPKPMKESSEEGEITTDNESTNDLIDASDLRHRLKRSIAVPDTSGSPDLRGKLKLREEGMVTADLEKKTNRSSSPDMEGPVLPPHLRRDQTRIGPTLPNEMRKVLAETSYNEPTQYESSEDEGIGPLPVGAEQKWTAAHKRLEERALDMKIRNLEGSSRSDVKSREEWMLELPEGKAKYLGLGPRQFRSREGPDMSDRSSWTDTPQQKALKDAGLVPPEEVSSAALQREARERHLAERDQQHEKAVKKHKKKHKRDESLLEMHQKKLKKKKKKEEKEDGVKARRPFDRDVDLQVNRFDDAQKKAVIKKAQHLDSRFSSGEAKYL